MKNLKKLQVADIYVMHLYKDELYLYDRSRKHDYIRLKPVEKSIVLAINEIHEIEQTWGSLREQYGILSDDIEARTLYYQFIAQMYEYGILVNGMSTNCVYGKDGKTYPAFVSMELTNKCNFQCTHCYKEAGSVNDSFLNTELALNILEQIAGKIYSLDITGGEATLHPEFARIIKAARVGRLCLLTNGSTLLNLPQETIEHIDEIQITLYGASVYTYEKYAKSYLFETVCSGIERVIKLGVNCIVAFQLRPDIIDELEKYILLLSTLGVKNIRIGMTQKVGRNKGSSSQWHVSYDDFERFQFILNRLKEKYSDINISEPSWEEEQKIYSETKNPSKIVCSAGEGRSLVISEKGNIRPCVYMPQKYFERISWKEYVLLADAGKIFDYNCCIQDYKSGLEPGESILSICSHGFG